MQIVKLEEILSDDLRKRIMECDKKIRKFIDLINTELPEKHKLPSPQMFIRRFDCMTFEDDGHTMAKGYHYQVYWICPVDKKCRSNDLVLLNSLSHSSLYFCYEDSERIGDKYSDGHNRFLSLYLSLKYLPLDVNVSNTQKIDYNNSNYHLTSVVNYENATTCILKLKEFFRQREIFDKIKKSSMLED